MRLKAAVVRKATKTRDDKRSAMYSPKAFEKIKKRVLDPNQSNEDPMPSPTVKRARTASYSPLVIDDDLNMDHTSGGNCSPKKHTLSQKYCDYNNGNVSSGYNF